MTSQCASGSGQFLENIARYLGIAQDEIGTLSQPRRQSGGREQHLRRPGGDRRDQHGVARDHDAEHPQGHPPVDGGAAVKLLKSIGVVDGAVMMTGGLALDKGLVAALEEDISHIKDMKVAVRSHPDSMYAGAIGAALWGAFRFEKLATTGRVPAAA